jgi:hypothetical protein
MWKALVNLAKRCLRTVLRKPAPKREARVQTPPEAYDEQAAALEYAHKLITEFLTIVEEWRAGTLDIQKYPMLRKPMPPARTRSAKPPRVRARPDSARKTQRHAAPASDRAPRRLPPAQPKFLRPLPFDSP